MEERSPSALTPLRRTRSVLPLPLLLQPPTYTTMTTTICQVVTIPGGKGETLIMMEKAIMVKYKVSLVAAPLPK